MVRGNVNAANNGGANVVAPIQDPSQQPGNVYFVHASDGPSSVSITPVLNHSNYHSWARSMRRALGAKNKFDFVDGSIPVPTEFDPSFKAWNRCNMLIHSWIMNSVEEAIAQSIVFLENAIDVWNELKEHFSQGDYIRISELQCEIFSLKQDSRSVSEFFTALKVLWEELEAYLPTPICSCPHRCVCITGLSNAKHQHEITRSIRFLTGLNDSFDIVRAQILLMNPLPPLNKIFSMVMQHERQFKISVSVDESKILINSASYGRSQGRGRGNGNGSSNQKRSCTFCGKTNHTVDTCYRKHGFPPNFGKNSAMANHSSLEMHEERDDLDGSKSVRGTESYGFTKDQYEQLVNLLQTSSSAAQVNLVPHVTSGTTKLAYALNSSNIGAWIIDSGASHHICSFLSIFDSHTSITPIHIKLPNGNMSIARIVGTVQFSPGLIAKKVLFVPDFKLNLLSVPKLCLDDNCIVSFDNDKCLIQDKRTLKMTGLGDLIEGLYFLSTQRPATIASSQTQLPQSTIIPQEALWHFRLGHISDHRLLGLHQDFPYVTIDKGYACDICHYSKHRKLPFKLSNNKASQCYELIHFDIWGPFSVQSIHGYKYFITALDDFSRFTWIFLCKSKSEVTKLVQNFLIMIENQYQCKVKIVRTDNGPEFSMSEFYSNKGIEHQTSCVETPQQNGRVERKHQHILNVGRALLFQSKLPKSFWSYAVLHATYLINRIPSPLLQNKSPFFLRFGNEPDLNELRVFGCLCYASTLQVHRTKFDSRARKSLFLGYKQGTKGSVLLDLNTKSIFISRHVTYHEHVFPYHNPNPPFSWTYHSNHPTPPDIDTSFPSITHDQNQHPPDQNQHSSIQTPIILDPDDHLNLTNINDNPLPSTTLPDTQPNDPIILRKSTRNIHKPSHLTDYICNSSKESTDPKSSGILYPINHFHSLSNLFASHSSFALSIIGASEPNSYKEASTQDCWIQAMNFELEALKHNKTWIFVDPPPNIKPIGCKWVYKVKHKADGSIERYKARLVAKGYNQVEGLDFFDTFSPVAKITTVRTLIALASIHSWHLHQLDVNNAFLHGDLHEEVYMHVPQGVTSPKPNQICKLLKSLYGLKQASRKWYEKLTGFLVSQGYKQSNADHSLFILDTNDSFTALLVYVDDVILAGNSISEIDRIKALLDAEFKIKNLGKLKYFLGIEVAHSTTGISICQRKYCLDLLKDTGLMASKPVTTPLDPSIKLHQDNSKPFEDILRYRRLVGKLLYLTTTRPDIAFVTQQLSQFLQAPTTVHYEAACRVVKYLKGSPGRGLVFRRDSNLQLLGFTDADWAGCLDTRRSTSGYCFFIGTSLISWRAKKQHTISRSSSEAEYRALSFASCELQWLLYLMQDLNIKCTKPPVLYCDNQSAIHIAGNPMFHERTKHLEIDCHFVREKLQQGIFKLLPVKSQAQLADFFTKPLPPKTFASFIPKLNMLDLFHAKLEGGC